MLKQFFIVTSVVVITCNLVLAQSVEQYTRQLESAVQNQNWSIANEAIQGLNSLGLSAERSTPEVLRSFKAAVAYRRAHETYKSETRLATIVFGYAAIILARFGEEEQIAQPLIDLFRYEMRTREGYYRGSKEVLGALAKCGPYATVVVPDIIRLMQEEESYSNEAYNVLGSIGPPAKSSVPVLLHELDEVRADLEAYEKTAIYSALARIDTANTGRYINLIANYLETDDWVHAMNSLEAIGPLARSHLPKINDKIQKNKEISGQSIVKTFLKIGGDEAVSEALKIVDSELSISNILTIGESAGAQEVKLALPSLVRALGINVTVDNVGMRTEVGQPRHTLSTRAAAAWVIRVNHLESEAIRLLRQDPSLISRAYKGMIELGVKESVPDLLNLLSSKGNKEMATVFLNSGHPRLESAAKQWVKAHGYSITGSYRSATNPSWGGQ